MGLVKINFVHKIPGLLKLFFRLSRKSHNHICGQGRIVKIPAQDTAFLIVLFAGIPAVHPFQCVVASALQRQMKMGTHLRKFRQSPGKFICNNSRFQGAKTDSPDSFNLMDSLNQGKKMPVSVKINAVRAQMDPCQHHFLIAVSGKGPHFIQHVLHRSAADSSSYVRDNAVSTELIAAVLHLDVSSCMFSGFCQMKFLILFCLSDFFNILNILPNI